MGIRRIELLIRGNLCNPALFEGELLLLNLKPLPNYARLDLNGETWLFVVGALSVNQVDKTQSAGCRLSAEHLVRIPGLATILDLARALDLDFVDLVRAVMAESK